MASWNLIVYYAHQIRPFYVQPQTDYNTLIQMISTHFKLIFDHYFLEIYDARFRCYVILDEEYILNLQDRLPKTSVSTLNGRLIPRKRTRHYFPQNRKRKRTSSLSANIDHVIIWLDVYPESSRQFQHQFYIITMLDIARAMLDYDDCIDDLIQTTSPSIEMNNHFNTFTNKEECLAFLQQVESTMKILFITSNRFSEEIVPLIVPRVQMIYILLNGTILSYDWAFNYICNLLLFDDSIHLLVRLIRDLAQNFVEKAEMMSKYSVEHAIVFFKWARKLFHRANAIDRPSCLKTLHSINRQLESLELISEEKDDKVALECDEG